MFHVKHRGLCIADQGFRDREGCFSLRPPRLPPAALRCGEPYSTWSVSVNVTVSTFFMEAYTFITIQYSTPARISEFRPGMPAFMMLVTSPTAKPAIH